MRLGACRRLTQYKWLITRYLRSYWRNPPFNTTRLLLAFAAALAQGSFYWSKGNNYGTASDVQVRSLLQLLAADALWVVLSATAACTLAAQRSVSWLLQRARIP